MVSVFQGEFAYSEKLRLEGGILRFYESEGVKSAIMRAQKQITGEGAILVERIGENELKITLFHREEDAARSVGEPFFSEIRTVLQEDRFSAKSDDDR